ncbi:MAG TPA: hypothetical protein VHO01_08240, partial [Jatrophihabitans sp.]|nr:hypothetical protein [Jatrophihabitans sp.]
VLAGHPDYGGFSCTMPLKRAVLQVATSVSDTARAIGAGNTLLPAADGWHADNTDWRGIRDCLRAHQVAATGRVLVLGAGGTAQAALAALPDAATITVAVRQPARARELLAAADRLGRTVTITALADLPRSDLLISTLPPGAADALTGPVPGAALDVVYDGWPTRFAARLASAGCRMVSGASMLLYQAAAQVELMTGRAAPVPAMRAALRAAVPGCGA